jgi:hypothetical protein
VHSKDFGKGLEGVINVIEVFGIHGAVKGRHHEFDAAILVEDGLRESPNLRTRQPAAEEHFLRPMSSDGIVSVLVPILESLLKFRLGQRLKSRWLILRGGVPVDSRKGDEDEQQPVEEGSNESMHKFEAGRRVEGIPTNTGMDGFSVRKYSAFR